MDGIKKGRMSASRTREVSSDILGSNNEIGRRLRQLYDEVVSEEVPERFAELLSQLDKIDPKRDGK